MFGLKDIKGSFKGINKAACVKANLSKDAKFAYNLEGRKV